ncbi:hypothetical protein F4859DRAFT_462093 [Xylaria cf. heliscus]|nr:hypothetical protein F4859DRAFT_462093 [Xylaria cf. heliscus]
MLNGRPVSMVTSSRAGCRVTDSSRVPGTPRIVTTPTYMRGFRALSYDLASGVTILSVLSRLLKITYNAYCEPNTTWANVFVVQSDKK